MRRGLIVTADDFGLSPGVCRGIRRAHEVGVVTATSALVLAPAFDAHAPWLRDSGIDVGLHLALVGEDPPLLGASEIPTLVDSHGRLARSWRTLVPRVVLGRVDPDDVRREWGAQMERLVAAGVTATHLDGHQHVHQLPQLRDPLVEVARRWGIRAVRLTSVSGTSVRARGLRRVADRSRAALEAAGLRAPGAFSGVDAAGHRGVGEMVEEVAGLARAGVAFAELASHPGEAIDPDRARYRWGYRWERELGALCDPRLRAAVAAHGFELADFGDLVRSGDAGGPAGTGVAP